MQISLAAARAGFEGDFDSAAATIYLATIPLVLATGLLVGLIYGAPQKLLAVAVALSASDAFYELVALAIPYIGATVGLGAALYAEGRSGVIRRSTRASSSTYCSLEAGWCRSRYSRRDDARNAPGNGIRPARVNVRGA